MKEASITTSGERAFQAEGEQRKYLPCDVNVLCVIWEEQGAWVAGIVRGGWEVGEERKEVVGRS